MSEVNKAVIKKNASNLIYKWDHNAVNAKGNYFCFLC